MRPPRLASALVVFGLLGAAPAAAPGPRPSPGVAPDVTTPPPALPAPVQVYPIDLCTALRLAETDNPAIGVSRQAILEAAAAQLRADVLLLPTLRAGANFHRHQGLLQTSAGEMRRVDESSLYAGGGAQAVGAGTVAIPMIQVSSPLADAFFEPLVARRLVSVRVARSAATTNAVLLDVADRFLELVTAEADLADARRSLRDVNEIVQLTGAFAKAGQGRQADAARARGEAHLLLVREERAEERVATASAGVAAILSLDTSVRLQTPARATGLLQLVPPPWDIETLVARARANRPEVVAAAAEVARRDAQAREEHLRPWLPTVSASFSTGTFGGGTNRTDLVPANPDFGKFGSRADFDVSAYWTVQNLGAGNRARAAERRAERDEATSDRVRVLNQVRREVEVAVAEVEAGRRQVIIDRRGLRVAEAAFREDVTRVRGGVGLPIEALNSSSRLADARAALNRSVLDHNRGQFHLFVALGLNPTSLCAGAGCAGPDGARTGASR